MTVKVRLRGALGNQLWQLTAGFLVAARSGELLTLDTALLDAYQSPYWLHEFDLDELGIRWSRKTRPLGMVRLGGPMRRGKQAAYAIALARFPRLRSVWLNEDIDGSNAAVDFVLSGGSPRSMQGYFQSPALAAAAMYWGLPAPLNLRNPSQTFQKTSSLAAIEAPVGVHIRMRDFPRESRLRPLEYEILLNKIDQIEKRNVWVFSDEPDALGEYVSVLSSTKWRLAPTDGLSPPELLCLMSLCRDFVSCRSTLSFWAGTWCRASGGTWIGAQSESI